MNERPNRNAANIDELPDRIEHRHKIARRLALDHPEYAVDDPSRTVNAAGGGYRVLGPEVQVRAVGRMAGNVQVCASYQTV